MVKTRAKSGNTSRPGWFMLALSCAGLCLITGALAQSSDPKHSDVPTAKSPSPRPGYGSPPRSVAQKKKILSDLYERLAATPDQATAEPLVMAIEQVWLYSGSDTINVLMERALDALNQDDPSLSLKLLDGITRYRPDYAEGWNRRAYVYFLQKDYGKALADLQRVLLLDSRHFKALNGLGTIFRELGQKAAALKAYRALIAIHPHLEDALQAVKELEREVEGDNI